MNDGLVMYMSRLDYSCARCRVRMQTPEGWFLNVGCGRTNLERWHPSAEIDDTGDLIQVVCEYDGGGNCFHKGREIVRITLAPDEYPSGERLKLLAGSATLPYCPPGWYFNTTAIAGDGEQATYSVLHCKKCKHCDYGRLEIESVYSKKCTGTGTTDTVRCEVGACDVGQYIYVNPDDNTRTCKACRTCGVQSL